VNFSPMARLPPAIQSLFKKWVSLFSTSGYPNWDLPAVLYLHIVWPQAASADRGKTELVLSDPLKTLIEQAIQSVTDQWRANHGNVWNPSPAQKQRFNRFLDPNKAPEDVKLCQMGKACQAHIVAAYNQVSSNGQLPANARQIMYVVRAAVLGKHPHLKFNDKYFTTEILPDFERKHPEITKDWRVCFDPRGRLYEPHDREGIAIGTLGVAHYIAQSRPEPTVVPVNTRIRLGEQVVQMAGPAGKFSAALFVEKEGFLPLIWQSGICERFGLAVMSNKGVATTAGRELVNRLASAGVKCLVLHDFDLTGFTIVKNFQERTKRYEQAGGQAAHIIDLGLRLSDVRALNLEQHQEPVTHDLKSHPCSGIPDYIMTREERTFVGGAMSIEDLTGDADKPTKRREGQVKREWRGNRVELNALTSAQFIEWLVAKLVELGIEPPPISAEVLQQAVDRATELAHAQALLDARPAFDPQASKLSVQEMQELNHTRRTHPEVPIEGLINACVQQRLARQAGVSSAH
jgi:hypothetical protein